MGGSKWWQTTGRTSPVGNSKKHRRQGADTVESQFTGKLYRTIRSDQWMLGIFSHTDVRSEAGMVKGGSKVVVLALLDRSPRHVRQGFLQWPPYQTVV